MKKIKLTESQLKKVIKTINEQVEKINEEDFLFDQFAYPDVQSWTYLINHPKGEILVEAKCMNITCSQIEYRVFDAPDTLTEEEKSYAEYITKLVHQRNTNQLKDVTEKFKIDSKIY